MNASKAFLCTLLLSSCATPTATDPTPIPTTGRTTKATATSAPTKTASPTPVKTHNATKAAQPTATVAVTAIPTATTATRANQPAQGSIPISPEVITSTVTSTTKTLVVTPTSTKNTSIIKTANNGQNQNTFSGILLPVGSAGFIVLAIASLLATLQIRRHQAQKRGEISVLAAQASVQIDPWPSQRAAEALSRQPTMSTEFANNTTSQPGTVPPFAR